MVERVTVVSGLKAAFPISLSQICARRSGSTGAYLSDHIPCSLLLSRSEISDEAFEAAMRDEAVNA